ncbi:Serine palmitoyltransferase 1 [Trametes pubescens]|uniref:serine C-palmitoyltransferase n=1 Tax=Trametes pubescens TaxID=154538 RepID=A0A1M2VDT3_TRAPU|nr:Serine palmitoyltransferase 1 [Trametes pubescens]
MTTQVAEDRDSDVFRHLFILDTPSHRPDLSQYWRLQLASALRKRLTIFADAPHGYYIVDDDRSEGQHEILGFFEGEDVYQALRDLRQARRSEPPVSDAALTEADSGRSLTEASPMSAHSRRVKGARQGSPCLRRAPILYNANANANSSADVHIQLEQDIADFLGTEAAILYSQAFSTISSVIPAFCKRGDIIVADRGVNFAIQKGLQISRCTVRWYDHNDMKSLEHVLESVEKECRKRKGPLTRRFIVTEGIFDHDGEMSDLPKLVRRKYNFTESLN